MAEFQEFAKIPRLKRDIVITEKIDGTNACIVFNEDGSFSHAQSRNRVIVPGDDNYGFALWVSENLEELSKLGPGHHYGEWWGMGIGRKYGMNHRRFSLFNTARWGVHNPNTPTCCHVVPVIAIRQDWVAIDVALADLQLNGSRAAPGFMDPEGLVVYHTASRNLYKVTCERDSEPKGNSQ